MKPDKLTVFELFEKKRRYIVPLYQRQYVWTREAQWEPLWEDIQEKARAVLDAEQSFSEKDPSHHFLGAIVLNQIRTFGKQIDSAQIIDGQQRLTTLQLFLAAFRDLVATSSEPDLERDLRTLTLHDGTKGEDNELYKVWPTNADRAAFSFVLSAGGHSSVETKFPQRFVGRRPLPRNAMADAYFYFYGAIRDYALSDTPDQTESSLSSDALHALFNTLRKYLELVVIELEEGDDPQVIFETLNFGGVPLYPSDLVRNFVFLRASQQKADTDALYHQLWLDFDTRPAEQEHGNSYPFWKQMEKQGRNKRTRLDLFLHHYLTYRKENEVNIGHLFREFRDWWETDRTRSAEVELRELRKHSDVFASFFAPDTATRLGSFAARLRILDTSTVYPLLLMLAMGEHNRIAPFCLDAILVDLESYLVRRAVCGLPIKHYNRFFLSLLQHLRKAESITAEGFRAQLLAAQGESTRWPTDAEFERHWIHSDAYQHVVPGAVKMILEAIDGCLRTTKSEQVTIQSTMHVEHILPRDWQTHWPLPTDSSYLIDDQSGETSADRRNRLLHTFGNLTLLTPPLNSAVSNGPFSLKRSEIARNSSMRLNAYFQDFTDQDPWDEDTIQQRGRVLLQTAKALWPHAG